MDPAWHEKVMDIGDVVEMIRAAGGGGTPMPTKVVGIDGRGGAGKTTLAKRMAQALGDAPVVQTDDFASWDNPIYWWPGLIERVLRPLAAGDTVRYQRYDWSERRHRDWIELEPYPPIVILEGVSATRREFDPYLAFRIWVDAASEKRFQRGVERDGLEMSEQWGRWMAEEEAHFARDKPLERADLVVSGDPSSRYDSEREIVTVNIRPATK